MDRLSDELIEEFDDFCFPNRGEVDQHYLPHLHIKIDRRFTVSPPSGDYQPNQPKLNGNAELRSSSASMGSLCC
jgi:hypothetical protein